MNKEQQIVIYTTMENMRDELDNKHKEEFLKYKLMEFIEEQHWKRDCLWWNEVLKERPAYDILFPTGNKWEWRDVGRFAIFPNTWTLYKVIAISEDWTPILLVVHTGDICFANDAVDLVS